MLARETARTRRGHIPVALAVAVLGAWAFLVVLVGPYFDFGFHTDAAWTFSEAHWTLSLGPGAAAVLGGLALLVGRGPAGAGLVLALAAGAWLVVGPSLHPLWASAVEPVAATEAKQALLWVGTYYGVGALVLVLAGVAAGLGRPRVEAVERWDEPEEPAPAETPRERTVVYP